MPEQKATFCRICEPLCGMVATVDELVWLPSAAVSMTSRTQELTQFSASKTVNS